MAKKKNVFVIGHKNPDTDSICSAISYAYLKNILSEKNNGEFRYVPSRAGQINEETQYVLNHFGVEAPRYISDIRPQVADIEYHRTEGVEEEEPRSAKDQDPAEAKAPVFPAQRIPAEQAEGKAG